MNWYMEDQKRRSEQKKTNDIVLLNQQLQRLLHEVSRDEEVREELKKVVVEISRRYNGSLLGTWHRGMMESIEVSSDALCILFKVIPQLEETNRSRLWQRIERCMRQLINIDYQYNFSLSNEYRDAKRKIMKIDKK